MKYAHIIAAAAAQPWAILDAKFDAIVSVLARCESGERFSEDEVRAVVGERKQKGLPYLVLESGVKIQPKSESSAAESQTGQDGLLSVWRAGTESPRDGSSLAAAASSKPAPKAVAVIPVWGILCQRVSQLDISETGTGVDQLAQAFRQALANPDVKAIVLDFDSPGGSVYGIDEFAQEIFNARAQKKIVAQVDPLCASAAYYLASQCSEIAIMPSGETGSIGVRTMHQDISKALELKGIKVTNISFGKFKTEGNPYEPLSEEGLAYAQQRVADYGEMFVAAVARGREVKKSDVKNGFGEGRMVGAAEAKRLGMVDRIATLEDTLTRLGVSADGGRVAIAAAAEMEVITAEADNHTEEAEMATTMTPAAAAAGFETERARCARLAQLASLNPKFAGKLQAWIEGNTSIEAAQAEIINGLTSAAVASPVLVPGAPAERELTGAYGAAEAASARVHVLADEADRLPKSSRLGRFFRAVAASRNDRRRGVAFARNVLRDPATASLLENAGTYEAAANPQDASSVSGGGFVIPENFVPDVIEYLRPKAVVRSLNPATAPLVNGNLGLPKITGGAVATYIGENKPAIPTKVTGGNVKATAKKLATLVPLSNDLLRYASVASDEMVRNDCMRAVMQTEDLSFIRGAGTTYTPRGIRNWALSASVLTMTATPTYLTTILDLGRLWTQLANSNVRFLNPGFIFAPRTRTWLYNLVTANGNWVYREEMRSGTVEGYPYRVTTQVPTNLGSGSDSEIYFCDFADIVVCDAPNIAVEVSTEAAYDDGAGNLTSAFSNDQTVLRMIVEHDLIVRHQESIAILSGVTWGS